MFLDTVHSLDQPQGLWIQTRMLSKFLLFIIFTHTVISARYIIVKTCYVTQCDIHGMYYMTQHMR